MGSHTITFEHALFQDLQIHYLLSGCVASVWVMMESLASDDLRLLKLVRGSKLPQPTYL